MIINEMSLIGYFHCFVSMLKANTRITARDEKKRKQNNANVSKHK